VAWGGFWTHAIQQRLCYSRIPIRDDLHVTAASPLRRCSSDGRDGEGTSRLSIPRIRRSRPEYHFTPM
jgi:hypothetical protein